MKQRATILSILTMTVIVCAALARAQTDGRVLGEVTTIDTTTRQITVKLTDGKSAKVSYDEKTLFRRVPLEHRPAFQGHVRENRRRRAAVARLHVAGATSAGPHAVQEVPRV